MGIRNWRKPSWPIEILGRKRCPEVETKKSQQKIIPRRVLTIFM